MRISWQEPGNFGITGIRNSGVHILLMICLLFLSGTAFPSSQTLLVNNGSTERVVIANDPLLNPVSGITIELWVRPNSVSGCSTLVGKGFATAYWLGICAGKIRYYTNGSGTNSDGNQSIAIGEWTHIAVSFDGAERRYYVNGELDAVAAGVGSSGVNDQPLGIGGEGGSNTYPDGLFPFDGRLSEVRLWNYARSIEQVRETMYQQITVTRTGLIGVWPLEGGAEDRFGQFFSTLAAGASWSGVQSPPVPHDPLRIRSAAGITVDGNCGDGGYSSSTVMPGWYEDADRLLAESNPQGIVIGADASYLYVCLDNRKLLDDSIYSIEIDPNNDGGLLLDSDDYRFRFWPGNDGLTTSRGQQVMIGNIKSSKWSNPVTNPAGLSAAEDLSVEFTADFEMRIPRSIFSDPSDVFRMRVLHNFLVGGGGDRSVIWPVAGASSQPSTWQEATVDLTPPPSPDSANPYFSNLFMDDDRPRFFEPAIIAADARDNIDLELVEILVDGVVVESMEYGESDNTRVRLVHEDTYPLGRHTYMARAFDHAGREGRSRFKAFQVDVDGEPPRVGLLISPREPAPGQTVTVTALAIDASEVRSIRIESILGGHLPTAKFCDLPAGGVFESCVWNISPGPDLTMVRLVASAVDDEGYSNTTSDYLVLWGNDGPDADDDGLADFTEQALCTNVNMPDTDGDGLSDGWEILGIQFSDGSELPLPEYGTNPCYKNLLLQLDFETGARPPTTGIDNLVNQYRERDTTVYADVNERPAPTAYDQSHIGSTDAVYQKEDGEFYFDPKRIWAFNYGYERNLPGRSGAWNRFFSIDHNSGSGGFCTSGPKQGKDCRGDFECGAGFSCAAGCTDGDNKGMSCTVSTDCPIDDGSFARCTAPCVTKPGATGTACGTIGDLPYRLFHELGHTVGLGHGGIQGSFATSSEGGFVTVDHRGDGQNFKPHQVSVMNYYYSQGLMCMRPPPTPIPGGYMPAITSEIAFMDTSLGDLNETQLSESFASSFAINLRAQDCSFSDPASFPVFLYTCIILDTQMEVLSDGQRTLAQKPKDGSWNFDVTAHDPGIDWNCNGLIDAGFVAENIDGAGNRSDGFSWDQSLWVLDTNLRGRSEFPLVPKPVSCHNLYSVNCEERAKSCYKWPVDYQNGILDLASGTAPVDCRDLFMDTRESHSRGACRGGADEEFGTGVCPTLDLDTAVVAVVSEKQTGGWEGMGMLSGPENDTGPIHIDGDPPYPVPGVEQCDMEDNDGDGEIDEDCRDTDSDGMPDVIDNCPTLANGDQADRDENGLGDACQYPLLSNPQAIWDGANSVDLSWNNDGKPLRGVVIYRYGEAAPRRLFRGSGYPSSSANDFVDEVSSGDTYTYILRPLNINGVEGEAVSVQVLVDIPEEVFADSFEDP